MSRKKILPLDDLQKKLDSLRDNQRIVHCHGVFDLMHVGHIRHLEQARELGDLLVVTLTPDKLVNKGPGRPYFPEELRAEALAALDCVDYVALNRWPMAIETIKFLRPHVYVKGKEFENVDVDVTGAAAKEKEAVESVGGEIAFTGDITFSSSSLLNRFMSTLPEETRRFLDGFRQNHSADEITSWLDRIRDLRVLVTGETILDAYQYCTGIGKSSKDPSLVVRAENEETFAGGIVAVANHIASFCDKVTLVTQLGDRNRREDFVRGQLNKSVDGVFLTRTDSPTIVKRRFVDRYFFTKLLEVYEINDSVPDPKDDKAMRGALEKCLAEHDVVVVVDYGHGMLSKGSADLLAEHSKFLALNVQANAGNLGYHTISKYSRADYVCTAENEMRLETRDRGGDLRSMMETVSRRISCGRVAVTRGSKGCLCYESSKGFTEVPAVATKVKDRVGAGDTFLAITAPCAALGMPPEMLGFLGNVAGAEAVATVGHSRYLERVPLIRHYTALLK